MSDGPLTGRVRRLISEFSLLLRDRADRAREWTEGLERRRSGIEAEHARALAEGEAAHERGADAARARHAARVRDEVAVLDARLAAERGALETALSAIKERAGSDEATIDKWLADKVWMADSVFESASPRPGEQFEVIRRDLANEGERLRGLEQRATAFLRACRLGALPTVTVEVAAGWGEAESAKRLTGASEAAQDGVARLERMILPRAFASLWPMGWALLGAMAGGGTAGLTAGWADGATLGIGAGAGLMAAVAVLGLVRWAAKRRCRAAAARIAGALAEGRAAGERWLEIASENRRRAEAHIKATHEHDVRSATTKAAAKRDEVAKARRERIAALHAEHDRQTADLAAQRASAAKAIEDELAAALAAAVAQRERAIRAADEARAHAAADLRARTERGRADLRAWYTEGMRAALAEWRACVGVVRDLCPAWGDPRWARGKWTPPTSVPAAVDVGWLTLDLRGLPGGLPTEAEFAVEGMPAEGRVELPVGLELPDRCSMVVKTGAQGRDEAVTLLRATMLRLLTTIPPGKARFTIIDPVGLGQNFAAFMHLADDDPGLVGDRIWTETRHIEQRLTDLTEHMENVIQKYLRNQFATIEEYNAEAGEVAEPYRFLVIADLPAGFNEMAGKRLASILDSGPRCGVYTLIAWDARQALPQGLSAGDLKKASLHLAWRGDGLAVDDADLGSLPMRVEAPPGDEVFNAMVRTAGRAAKERSKVQVPFTMIAPESDETGAGLWGLSSAKEVRTPIGRAGATKLQHLTLGRGTAQHALIAGRTGSGKSTLLHALITSLATWYGPDEVEMYLVDFKKGVEFKPYAAHGVPHARVIAIESEREFGLSVLRRLDAELKRRGELFREAGAQDIAAYRERRPGERMPRVVLIIDEFQELFVEDDRLAQEATLLLDRLVRQGRAFGMHAILGSQTLGGAYSLARTTIGQMAVRIALQCSEADSYLILSDDNPAARLLARPGEAIYNDASGALEGNSPFQVAWLPEEQRDRYLAMIGARARAAGNGAAARREAPIIFEGSSPANIDRNAALADLLAGRAAPRTGATMAYLGEPIAIKEPTAAVFRRQSAANLLIIGQRDEAALAMFVSSLVSLAAQGSRAADAGAPARVVILDGTPADAPHAGTLERAARAVGPAARVVPYREAEAALGDLANRIDQRLRDDATDAEPVFLMVYGLQRFRTLRRPENEFDFGGGEAGGATPDKLFLRIIREGPAAGVHVIAWADTLASLNRTLERSALREFDQRVLFQMSAADSSALIDVPGAGLIGPHRALLFCEEQGTLEKFRPYALPEEAWMDSVAARRSITAP